MIRLLTFQGRTREKKAYPGKVQNSCPQMALTLEQQRAKSRQLFKRHLHEIFNSKEYQSEWNKTLCGKQGFKIEQFKPKYKIQIANVLSYCFSLTSSTKLDQILSINVAEQYPIFVDLVDHIIKTGLGYCIVDKDEQVIMIMWSVDYCDKPSINPQILSDNIKHQMELLTYLEKLSLPIYPSSLRNKNAIKYGEFIYTVGVAVRPDYWGKIKVFKVNLMLPILISMGYNYLCSIADNKKSISASNRAAQAFKWMNICNINLYQQNIKFKNGIIFNDYVDRHPKYKPQDTNICLMIQDWNQFKQTLPDSYTGSKLGHALYLTFRGKRVSNL